MRKHITRRKALKAGGAAPAVTGAAATLGFPLSGGGTGITFAADDVMPQTHFSCHSLFVILRNARKHSDIFRYTWKHLSTRCFDIKGTKKAVISTVNQTFVRVARGDFIPTKMTFYKLHQSFPCPSASTAIDASKVWIAGVGGINQHRIENRGNVEEDGLIAK